MPSAADQPTASVHEVASKGFSLQVDAYEQGRPGYPTEGVDYALRELGIRGAPKGSKKAVDLAAGTGKLTRQLLSNQELEVIAVEPNEAMIDGFKKVLPGVSILQGTADRLPFDNDSVDVVFVGQGFHWFANEAALAEVHRVLRPGTGALALFWNREDEGVPWAADLLAVFEPLSRGIPQYWTGDWVRVWRTPLAQSLYDVPAEDPRSRSKFFRHATRMTRGQVWQRIVSRSYVASLPPEKLEEVRVRVDEVIRKHDHLFTSPEDGAGEQLAEVPLRLEIFIARRRA